MRSGTAESTRVGCDITCDQYQLMITFSKEETKTRKDSDVDFEASRRST